MKEVASWSKPDGVPGLIGRKKVDWSIFEDGTTIPLEFHADFREANNGFSPARGESVEVLPSGRRPSIRRTIGQRGQGGCLRYAPARQVKGRTGLRPGHRLQRRGREDTG